MTLLRTFQPVPPSNRLSLIRELLAGNSSEYIAQASIELESEAPPRAPMTPRHTPRPLRQVRHYEHLVDPPIGAAMRALASGLSIAELLTFGLFLSMALRNSMWLMPESERQRTAVPQRWIVRFIWATHRGLFRISGRSIHPKLLDDSATR